VSQPSPSQPNEHNFGSSEERKQLEIHRQTVHALQDELKPGIKQQTTTDKLITNYIGDLEKIFVYLEDLMTRFNMVLLSNPKAFPNFDAFAGLIGEAKNGIKKAMKPLNKAMKNLELIKKLENDIKAFDSIDTIQGQFIDNLDQCREILKEVERQLTDAQVYIV